MMRKFLMLVFGFAMLALFVGEAAAMKGGVKLTVDQVQTVCGNKMHTTRGVDGCSKACANGQHTCSFLCDKSGCAGYCEDCGVRTGGKDDPVAAVKGVLGRSQ